MTGDEQLDRTRGSKQHGEWPVIVHWDSESAVPKKKTLGFSLRDPLLRGARGGSYRAPVGPTEEGARGS